MYTPHFLTQLKTHLTPIPSNQKMDKLSLVRYLKDTFFSHCSCVMVEYTISHQVHGMEFLCHRIQQKSITPMNFYGIHWKSMIPMNSCHIIHWKAITSMNSYVTESTRNQSHSWFLMSQNPLESNHTFSFSRQSKVPESESYIFSSGNHNKSNWSKNDITVSNTLLVLNCQ